MLLGYILAAMGGASVGVLVTCLIVSGQRARPAATPEEAAYMRAAMRDAALRGGLWL